jgi:NitT/TauT family transport system permease protein
MRLVIAEASRHERIGAVALAAQTRTARRARFPLVAARLGVLVAVVVLWQLAAAGKLLDPYFYSKPSAIWSSLQSLIVSGKLPGNLLITTEEIAIGYVVGSIAGIVLAVVLTSSRWFTEVVEPFFLAVYSVPSIALAPLFIVWFGLGMTSKVVLAAYYVFFVVFLNVGAGVRAIRISWIQAAQLMGATRWQLVRTVVLPGTAPHLFAGLRTALPQALVGAIVGEFLSGQHGIGTLVVDASARYDTAGVFAAIAVLSGLILCMNALLDASSGHAELRLR